MQPWPSLTILRLREAHCDGEWVPQVCGAPGRHAWTWVYGEPPPGPSQLLTPLESGILPPSIIILLQLLDTQD